MPVSLRTKLTVPLAQSAFQIRNVALARAQVPAQLIKGFPFRVHLGGDDFLMFCPRNGPFFLKSHLRPFPFGQD
jgi:hypothetical protein